MTTLIGALRKTGGKRGVASLCIGGGEATAVASKSLTALSRPAASPRSATGKGVCHAHSSRPALARPGSICPAVPRRWLA
jgi:hypothetical protein